MKLIVILSLVTALAAQSKLNLCIVEEKIEEL
jgi:hypothetical protein